MKNKRLFQVFVVLGLVCGFICAEDYYEEIGVDSSATTEEIGAKCREQMAKSHPQKNADSPDAHEKFKEVAHACQVLKNKTEREAYDASLQKGSKPSRASSRGATLAIEAPASKKKPQAPIAQ